MHRMERGFTLVEMVVTVAIAAIIMGIGIPSYRQYMQRANRADATTALLRLAANQERFYLQNNTYATEAQRPLAPPNGIGMTGTERGYYTLVLAAKPGGWASGYTATATVAAGSNQTTDTACWNFTIDEQGLRTANTQGGAAGNNTDTCWR
jgi:type IV pilus assembly protein PilE